jgi:hypothetical protein
MVASPAAGSWIRLRPDLVRPWPDPVLALYGPAGHGLAWRGRMWPGGAWRGLTQPETAVHKGEGGVGGGGAAVPAVVGIQALWAAGGEVGIHDGGCQSRY